MANLHPQHRRIGSLEVIEIRASSDAPTIVFMHGYGADCTDLVPLAAHLAVGRPVNWIFPNGPQEVDLGAHVTGRGWFPISISELEKSGEPLAFANVQPPGMKKAREAVLTMIQTLGIEPHRLILGGFSQGAMVAVDVALHLQKGPAGVAILSGTAVNAETWARLAPVKAGLSFFQCHGSADTVLSIAGARHLNQLLQKAGWKGDLLEFDGGHEIPLPVLSQLSQYLKRIAALPAPR